MTKTLDEVELRALLGLEGAPEALHTPYTANARYASSLEGFNIKLPAVPAHTFVAERDRAFHRGTPTGLIPLDLGARLRTGSAATTPLILARYARIRAGEALRTELHGTAELYYVIAGAGHTAFGEGGRERIGWESGDAFSLPGGGVSTHVAGPSDAVLWLVTDEPALAFLGARPPAPGDAPGLPVHYPAVKIGRHLCRIHQDSRAAGMVGKAVTFGSVALPDRHTVTPSFTLAMNSLLPGETQRAHRHNAVAVTLIVAGRGCYSTIEGRRIDWEPQAVMITPPAELHSHHNEGADMALFLIVQDGGLHYHCRTMGFSFD